MFKPDESARDLFRRKLLPSLDFKTIEKLENVQFGDVFEVQAESKNTAEVVLTLSHQFLISSTQGYLIHTSTGNSISYLLSIRAYYHFICDTYI